MRVPDGWFDYSRFGSPIDSTRIIAVKTPLKMQFNSGKPARLSLDYAKILRGVPIEEEFTPQQMLQQFGERGWHVGLVIDLTFTDRYYEPQEFIQQGVQHLKIKCPGQIIPPDNIYQQLSSSVSKFLSDARNGKALVAVHCTHGLNRTGYLVCRYLMEKCGYNAERAIKAFNKGRGHDIERQNYLEHLRKGCPMEATQSQSPGRSKPPPHHVGAAGREDAERHPQVKAKHHPHHHHYHHHHHHDSQYNTESHSLLPYSRGSDTNGGEGGGGGGQYRRSEVGGQEWDLRVRLNRKAALSSRERERRGERQDERRGERQDERRGWGHVDNRDDGGFARLPGHGVEDSYGMETEYEHHYSQRPPQTRYTPQHHYYTEGANPGNWTHNYPGVESWTGHVKQDSDHSSSWGASHARDVGRGKRRGTLW